MELKWVTLSAALEHVTSVVLSPIMAERRLRDVLERGELAAKAEEIAITKLRYIEAQLNPQFTMRAYDGSVDDHQTQLGPDWLLPEVWNYADVDWAASSFQSQAGFMPHAHDGYVVTGVRVSAQQIRKLFPVDDAAVQPEAKPKTPARRGRRPGSGINDDALLIEMAELLKNGEADNPTNAAEQVAPRAKKGASESANKDRLRRKFMKRFPGWEEWRKNQPS